MIQLPDYLWFVQKQGSKYLTNVFTGSLGTDPQKGCVNKTTFHYRAFVKMDEDGAPVFFHVECYSALPWSCEKKSFETVTKDFEALPESITKAEEWLEMQYTKEKGEP